MDSNYIAIVGMGGRFPGCDDLDGLWDLLRQRKDVHQEVPPSRFDINDYYDSSGETENSILTRYGCFLNQPGLFDNRFFNISPREAAQLDPLQRIFLTTTYEALEMAGYNPDTCTVDPTRIATYFGQSTDDWRTVIEHQGIQAHYLPATNRSFAPGRVSHYFKWGGGHYSIDTGCSSSMTAIHQACAALISQECDMAVVGGGNICVIPEYFSGFSKGSFLSPTGGCKTFSDAADGYCRGEAVGTVILKRLGDAVAANDNILGVVSATARNSNAGEGSITYPGETAQKKLLEGLLGKAKTRPDEIGFVEMHGTGTQAGDWVEMNTVRSVLTGTPRDQLLYVGALKANIGHGEAAAGISSLIKALLMLRHDAIPGQPGDLSRFKDLAASGIQIGGAEGLSTSIPRSVVDGRRKVVVNSFDAAGGNTSLLLQDGPTPEQKEQDPRTHHIVTCSAKTVDSLRLNRDRLRKYLEKCQPKPSLADLGYTTTARRISHAHREAYVVDSIEQLIAELKSPSVPASSSSSLAFIFTGQSSQYTAMGETLYNTCPRFQQILNAYECLCSSFTSGSSFLDVIRGTVDIESATAPQVQVALVALEIALAHFLQELGLKPNMVMGHSLGEYSALCAAGVLSVRDALYLVHERAALLETYCTAGSWGMMAVPLGAEALKKLLQGLLDLNNQVEICCMNEPSLTVVGGPSESLEMLQGALNTKGIASTRRLQLPYAFHTSQLDCLLPEFEAAAETISFQRPSAPLVSTLTGRLVTTISASYLVQQCRQPVNFTGALKTAQEESLISNGSFVIEIGPHPVCSRFLTPCLPNTKLAAVPTLQRGHADWKVISKCLATAYAHHQPVKWDVFHSDYQHCLSLITLPSYAFEQIEYWTPYQRQKGAEAKNNGFQATTCLQQIESLSADKGSATFVSNPQEPFLFRAIQGHLVDGVAICPASLFIDMACGAAQAMVQKVKGIEVADLQMTSPLVVSASDAEQIIRVNAHAEAKANPRAVNLQVSSTTQGNPMQHAACRVILHEDNLAELRTSMSVWPQVQRLVQLRANALKTAPSSETCHKLTRGLFYKLFDSLVEYSSPFRLLENITIDGDAQDAVAEIRVRPSEAHGTFSLDPFAVDALVHLPGFVLNCSLDKPKGDIHIAKSIGRVMILDGWRAEGLAPLTCYATVTGQAEDGTTLCDTYCFRDGNLAAMVTGICFQKITRQIFEIITGIGASTARPKPSPNRVAVADSPVTDNSMAPSSSIDEGVYSVFLCSVETITGINMEQVKPADSFEALGVDSHMAISIIAETNKSAGVLLPAAFFTNFPTIADAERELKGSSSPDGILTPPSSDDESEAITPPLGKAILIQGNPKSTKTPLFLISESSGSATVYLRLPPLPSGTPIYALESPFASLESFEKQDMTVPSFAKAYIAAMRTIQPQGPYLVGGFSFAGIYAYEIAYQLALTNERLLGLLLMDMYAPPPALPSLGTQRFLGAFPTGPLENLTTRFAERFLFRFNDAQKAHMGAALGAAADYEAFPIPKGLAPFQTHIVWGNKGVNENGHPDEFDEGVNAGVLGSDSAFMGLLPEGKDWEDVSEEEMGLLLRSWFFTPRRTFRANGWEVFVGDGDIVVHEVDGDHCSLIVAPDVQNLGEAIASAVESCMAT